MHSAIKSFNQIKRLYKYFISSILFIQKLIIDKVFVGYSEFWFYMNFNSLDPQFEFRLPCIWHKHKFTLKRMMNEQTDNRRTDRLTDMGYIPFMESTWIVSPRRVVNLSFSLIPFVKYVPETIWFSIRPG